MRHRLPKKQPQTSLQEMFMRQSMKTQQAYPMPQLHSPLVLQIPLWIIPIPPTLVLVWQSPRTPCLMITFTLLPLVLKQQLPQ
ncbi:hypothetical protein V1264_008990 [Littorina saxatilis]|uniref:Uncharacterized protein n=1 Tax=Littorina saxatilis TaxID=31220 RepID=A0AAN9AQM0_9CAEN